MKASIYYRVCHVCGHLNESSSHGISECTHCKKSFVPFFYFDDRLTFGNTQNFEDFKKSGDYMPILGLTVYWDKT